MPLLSVDPEKCSRDGHCAAECPAKIIELKGDNGLPTLVDGGRELCIACGHCVAVCPHGALSHELMPAEACAPVPDRWQLTPSLVGALLRSRRSIRTYRRQEVDRGVLAQLIDIARYAPSGHNLQPVHWTVVYDRSRMNRLSGHVIDWMKDLIAGDSPLARALHLDRIVEAWKSGTDRILRGAPHVVVAHASKEDRTAPAACTIALCYLEISAPAYGLGACWAGYLHAAAGLWPPLGEALALPPGHAAFGALMIGYPKYEYHRVPLRKNARISWK